MPVPADRVREELRRAASMLVSERVTESTDIAALLAELNLRLVMKPRQHNERPAAALVRTNAGFEIVVGVEDESDLSARERFTVAHELAHFYLETEFALRPADESEYWKIEQLCNEFAADLLLPDAIIAAALNPPVETSGELLGRTNRLARKNRVSVEVAARKVVERIGNASIAALEVHAPRPDVVGTVRWCTETADWISGGRGKHLSTNHRIASVLLAYQSATSTRHRRDVIGGIEVASKRLGSSVLLAALLGPSAGSGPAGEVGSPTAQLAFQLDSH